MLAAALVLTNDKLDTYQMSMCKWVDEQTSMASHCEILFSDAKKWAMETDDNLDESQGHDATLRKSYIKQSILSLPLYDRMYLQNM